MTLLHTILPSGEVTSVEYQGPLEYRCVPFQAIRRLIDPRDEGRLTIEHVSDLWRGTAAHMFVDEEGIRKELPFNPRAWRIYLNASLRREAGHRLLYYDLLRSPEFTRAELESAGTKLRVQIRTCPPIVGPAVLWEGDMT